MTTREKIKRAFGFDAEVLEVLKPRREPLVLPPTVCDELEKRGIKKLQGREFIRSEYVPRAS